MGYLAHGHPFLEGNGRTLMVVHNELVFRAGISIDWMQTDKDGHLAALTRELNFPGSRPLDTYLRPFIGPTMSREQAAIRLSELPGLGPDHDQIRAIAAAGGDNREHDNDHEK